MARTKREQRHQCTSCLCLMVMVVGGGYKCLNDRCLKYKQVQSQSVQSAQSVQSRK
jgi:hypothetical protein